MNCNVRNKIKYASLGSIRQSELEENLGKILFYEARACCSFALLALPHALMHVFN